MNSEPKLVTMKNQSEIGTPVAAAPRPGTNPAATATMSTTAICLSRLE